MYKENVAIQGINGLFALLLVTIGILNIVWVHPVPGVIYFVLALVYVPPLYAWLKEQWGIAIHRVVKIFLAIAIVMFTLGVSDLGDIIDKW
ncbi:MAG: hypothetical protein WD554_03840 [Flavobacteriaceae bacterium]